MVGLKAESEEGTAADMGGREEEDVSVWFACLEGGSADVNVDVDVACWVDDMGTEEDRDLLMLLLLLFVDVEAGVDAGVGADEGREVGVDGVTAVVVVLLTEGSGGLL